MRDSVFELGAPNVGKSQIEVISNPMQDGRPVILGSNVRNGKQSNLPSRLSGSSWLFTIFQGPAYKGPRRSM